MTHGQCDARPTVTFPVAERRRPLAGTKLYCLVTEAHGCEQIAQSCYSVADRLGVELAIFRSRANALPTEPRSHPPLPLGGHKPHLTQCVIVLYRCTYQTASKSVEWFKQGARMCDRRQTDRTHHSEMCTNRQNYVTLLGLQIYLKFCLKLSSIEKTKPSQSDNTITTTTIIFGFCLTGLVLISCWAGPQNKTLRTAYGTFAPLPVHPLAHSPQRLLTPAC